MPSPFPGMDPYIEARGNWMSFHNAFISVCWERLNATLPERYVASLDERTQLVEVTEEEERRVVRPDVAVTRDHFADQGAQPAMGGVATLEPLEIPLPLYDELIERRIEIHTEPQHELVAVIEMLSPTNKSYDGFAQYTSKRRAILRQKVHLLEIDLLVQGERLPLSQRLPEGDYYALLSRANRRPMCDVYAWKLRDPLPTLPVPLQASDRDVPLNLREVFDLTYDRGRYRQLLGYDRKLGLPLSEDDLAWARNVVDGSTTPR